MFNASTPTSNATCCTQNVSPLVRVGKMRGLQDLTFDRLKQMRHSAGADEKWLYIEDYEEENQGN